MSVPFVGRRPELDAIDALVRRGRREAAPAAALIVGAPGSGKSRLLAEALRADHPGIVRLVGFEPMQGVPLAGVSDLLRVLTAAPREGPRLEGLVFGSGEAADPSGLRAFEAAHRALGELGPLLLAIDDLQWLDDRSLGLLHYLLRAAGPASRRLAVIAAARPSAAAATLRAQLEAELPAARRATIELGPLPLEDGVRLVRSIDGEVSGPTAVALWKRARGSPFWLEALARSREADDPAALIEERLGALRGDAGELLAIMAVGARPFLRDEVADLLGWDLDRLRAAGGELVARGLMVEGAGTIRLAHDLIREAAAASLPVAARRRLHARLADAIEAAGTDDVRVLREALDHRVAAGEPAAALAARLISAPTRRLLDAEGLRLVASISDRLPRASPERIGLNRGIAELAAAGGEVELALGRWHLVSEESADARERRQADVDAAWTAYRTGRRVAAHDLLDRARLHPSASADELVRLEAIQADVELWLDHETAVGSATAARALGAAERLATAAGGLDGLDRSGRRAYLAAIEVSIDAAMQEGRDDAVPDLAAQCVRVSTTLDDEVHVAAIIRSAQALRTVTRMRDAEALGSQAWASARQHVLPTLMVGAGRERARALRDLGQLADAHEMAVETQDLEARLTDAPRHWGSAPSIAHLIQLSIGDPRAALDALRRDAAAESDPHYRQDLHLAIAQWQARTVGPPASEEVVAELAAARIDADLARCPRHSTSLALATAELLARVGHVDEARRQLADWDRRPGPGGVLRELSRDRTAAAIAAADLDHATAVAHLEALSDGLERRGMRQQLLWTWMDLGRSLAAIDRSRAVVRFSAAAALAEACGAATEGRQIARELRRLGVRAWRRGRAGTGSGADGLSTREREIAGLVAGGVSNRDVAEALLISPKTVERHVTNVLAKVGVRNRTELAAAMGAARVRESPDE